MSTTPTIDSNTLDRPTAESRDPSTIDYRAIYSGALIAALLGLVSLSMLAVTNFLEVALMVSVIPAIGIAMSLLAIRKISHASDIYTGKPLAWFGLALSTVLLTGGLGRATYIHATEVPDGYTRISFLSLQPDSKDKIASRPVPKKTIDLMSNGKPVFIKGYIRPGSIVPNGGADEFLLVRDNKQCCFGDLQSVKYFDQVLVRLPPDFSATDDLSVTRVGGRLLCAPQNLGRGSDYPVYFLQADYLK